MTVGVKSSLRLLTKESGEESPWEPAAIIRDPFPARFHALVSFNICLSVRSLRLFCFFFAMYLLA